MSKFKVLGVGLDTENLQYPLMEDEFYDYIMTNLSSNNDYLIGNYFKKNPESMLIVKTDYLDTLEITLKSHMEEVGKSSISLLLISPEADWTKLERLPFIGSWGLSHPTTIEDVIKADNALKEKELKLEYVLMSACPLDYNYELIEKIKFLNIEVIVDNPMGGYLSAPRNISAFSAPYLLCFAANQSSLVFVSGRDEIKAAESRDYLKALMGKESSEMFELKKTIQKPVKPIKKVIYTSTKIGKDYAIPYEDPTILTTTEDTIFTLGKWTEKLIPIEEPTKDGIEDKIRNLLEATYIPTDAKGKSLFAHLRYRVEKYLEGYLESEGYELDYSYQDSIMLITATKPEFHRGLLWWYKYIPEEKRYFCFMLNQKGEPLFYEIDEKISPVNPENP